eukprot:COSAG01_NODE_27795_length_676_cov_13.447140_1_plen_36_part_10
MSIISPVEGSEVRFVFQLGCFRYCGQGWARWLQRAD